MLPIDADTYAMLLRVQERAKKLGMDPLEGFQQADLLLTPRRRHEISVDAAGDLVRRLRRQSPNKLMSFSLQRVEGTAAEMFEATLVWLDLYLQQLADGTLEDL